MLKGIKKIKRMDKKTQLKSANCMRKQQIPYRDEQGLGVGIGMEYCQGRQGWLTSFIK